MKITARCLGGATLALAFSTAAWGQAAPAPQPPSAEAFARRPAVSHVTISPDGKHMAAILSPDGETNFVQVWSTDAPSENPWRTGLPSNDQGLRFTSVSFLKNDRIAVTYRGFAFRGNPVSDDQDSQPSVTVILTPGGKNADPPVMRGIGARDGPLVDRLPRDPKHVVIDWGGWPQLIDVYAGTGGLIAFEAPKWGAEVDPRAAGRVECKPVGDGAKAAITCRARPVLGQPWKQLLSWRAVDREPVAYAGGTEDPNVFLLRTRAGGGRAAIVPFDINTQKELPVVFAPRFFDAGEPVVSYRARDTGHVVGFTEDADEHRVHWTDPAFAAAQAKARELLKVRAAALDWTDPETGAQGAIDTVDDFDVRIADYSDDFNRIVIEKSGPRQPPEYYLLSDGDKLTLVGKSHPDIDPAALGHARLTEFKARDGLIIPVIVTTPAEAIYGKGPHPAIVVPHDGPWERDYLEWDPTGRVQFFAARGYVVIQPQFRGSTGFGSKLWRAGDRQWGLKIQDDIDDAALWAGAQGLADPARVAIHGYGFGGYEAFVAATRSNGVFRCAIAGAGFGRADPVSEWEAGGTFDYYTREIAYGGFSPIDGVNRVAIPVMAYHGGADRRVSQTASKRFTEGLHDAHRASEYLEFPQMGHKIVRWTPDDKREVLTSVESFLKTDCGMGG